MPDFVKSSNSTLHPEIYSELRKVAQSQLARERAGHTLQATALVHEAWLRLASQDAFEDMGRQQFYIAAASMMRRILIDYARGRRAVKRGGDVLQLVLDDSTMPENSSEIDLIQLDDALNRLAEHNKRHAQIVELRYFAGLTINETAAALDVSDYTVKSDWRMARAWLLSELSKD